MTTLTDRPNTALLVVDVQNGVVAKAHDRNAVVANIDTLVGRARAHGVPVVWVRHADEDLQPDTADWQIVPELSPEASEPIVDKRYGDSFEDTTLEGVLADAKIGRLYVV